MCALLIRLYHCWSLTDLDVADSVSAAVLKAGIASFAIRRQPAALTRDCSIFGCWAPRRLGFCAVLANSDRKHGLHGVLGC